MATLFRENGIDHDKVNYFNEVFTKKGLKALIAKTGRKPFDLLRPGSALSPDAPDDEVIAAMVQDPNLIQRPIVEVGDKAILGRPAERALDLLQDED